MHFKTIFNFFAAAVLFAVSAGPASAAVGDATKSKTTVVQEIRNATVKITIGGKTFLVDPMLAKKDTYPGFEGTYRSELRNPMIELPMDAADVIKGVDAVVVTHTHLDHWDHAAQKLLPKDIPLYAQDDADAKLIRSQGFKNVRVLTDSADFDGVKISKTGGKHGTDFMYEAADRAKILGHVMGVVLQAPGFKTVYVAGDTVWRSEVDETLSKYKPSVIVLNTGDARWTGYSDPIIMGKEDALHAYRVAKDADIVAVHMDAINHTALSRTEMRKYVKEQNIQDRVRVPADGEALKF